MSNLGSQISYYLRIAIDINKKIGGTKAYQAEKKAKDKFSILRQQISKKIYFIRNALERKPQSKGISLSDTDEEEEIRQALRQVNSCILRIKDSVDEEKSNNTTKQLKKQIIEKLEQQYKNYQQILYQNNEADLTGRGMLSNQTKNKTLTDMRTRLIGDDEGTVSSDKKNKNNYNTQATQIQMEKMEYWKKQEEDIDDNVDIIIEKTRTLKTGIDQAGKLVNQIDAKVKLLTTNVQNLNEDLVKSNKKLKGVIEKFRKPHKFCIDVILTIILIGLIVGMIKVSSS